PTHRRHIKDIPFRGTPLSPRRAVEVILVRRQLKRGRDRYGPIGVGYVRVRRRIDERPERRNAVTGARQDAVAGRHPDAGARYWRECGHVHAATWRAAAAARQSRRKPAYLHPAER